jgi:uncharacterized protein
LKRLKWIANLPAPIRILAFLLVCIIAWAPFALVIYSYLKSTYDLADPGTLNLLNIFVMGGLGLTFIVLLPWWTKAIYDRSQAFSHLGLVRSYRNFWGLLQGWSIGFASLLLLYLVQGWLGWLTWQPVAIPWLDLIGGGLLSSLGVGFAEELVFRGWMLDELETDYSKLVALWSNALIFAALHFGDLLKIILGWPHFLGLTILGMLLVLAKRSQKNLLGIAIGLHAGLIGVIYLIDVGKMVKYTNKVPEWTTGIGGHPSAGILGIFALVVLLGYFARLNRFVA